MPCSICLGLLHKSLQMPLCVSSGVQQSDVLLHVKRVSVCAQWLLFDYQMQHAHHHQIIRPVRCSAQPYTHLTGLCYATAVSVTSMLVQLYAADGIAAFYKGFSPAFSRSVPANAAAFLVYEMVRQTMTRD